MNDRKSIIPMPMPDPCQFCPKADRCKSQETYKCDLFQVIFIRAWNDAVSFLKEQLDVK